MKKPNIVYLHIEHLKASATSVHGNQLSPCHFLEKMASQGMSFMNAYSPSPMCTPSRISALTGVHPLVHQSYCHQNRAPVNLPQISEIFQQNGYFTAVAGHYEPERNLSRGWHEQVDHRSPGPLRKSADKWLTQGMPEYGWKSGTLDSNIEEQNSYLLTERFIRMIDEADKSGMPAFLHLCYNDPHPPYYAPPPYNQVADPSFIPVPNMGSVEMGPDWQNQARAEAKTSHSKPEDIQQLIAMYYGMISLVNDQMERVYRAFQDRGMLENTWFFISSDHGEYAGEKGLFGQTESLYECLLHVPMIIVPPPSLKAPRGKKIEDFIDTTDTFATLLAMAEIGIPDYTQGFDLTQYLKNEQQSPFRDCVHSQVGLYHGYLKNTLPGGLPSTGRRTCLVEGVRDATFSYMTDEQYGNEAYDLREDPSEICNLAGKNMNEEQKKQSDRMLSKIESWHEQCVNLKNELGVIPGDRGFVKNWEGA